MKHESKEDAERAILERMSRLDAQQIFEVLNYIDFLADKKQRLSAVAELLKEAAGPRVNLHDGARVWLRLKGSCRMSFASSVTSADELLLP